MTLNGIGGIAASGLAFQRTRLDASASNIAGALAEDHVPIEVRAQTLPSGGVESELVELEGPPSPIREFVNLRSAVAAYRANLAVFATADEMAGSLLDTKG